ncbi:hypothetical protein PK28_11985 [Hymenobacter sp. DG25B]|uniref:hypothetical protein n=1 Tax=Hymenobacter sp. DG25B TaxID=1385664 RepID=UPI000540A20E|nr:hypothetical protein [Hymenobacter sp. DG25B]AIZ64225.1 hypothetical protein PK28_11985 [Hymenobacter sp. DG25B]
MKKILPLALFLLMAGLDACNRTPAPIDPASPAAAKAQISVLQDTVEARWTEMITSDNAKHSATRQIIRELQDQPGTDRTQLQQLLKANNRLKGLRYNQQTMQESARIDAYDAAQDSVLRAVYTVALPEAGQKSELVRNLTEGIQQSDAEVVAFRVRYDKAAQRFNDYLQLHQAELSELGGKYAKLKPLPLFTIQQ